MEIRKRLLSSLVALANFIRIINCYCQCSLSPDFVLTIDCTFMTTRLTSRGLFEQLCDAEVTQVEFYTAKSTDLELRLSSFESLSFPAGLLAGFWLKVLDLSNNYLSELTSQMLDGVLGIEELDISSNEVQSLEWLAGNDVFNNITSLTLDFNQLMSLKGSCPYFS